MTFHLTNCNFRYLRDGFGSVWVAEWPFFGGKIAARSVSNLFSLYFVFCDNYLFPVLVLRAGFAF